MEVKVKNADKVIKNFIKFANVNERALVSAMNRANTAGQTASSLVMRKKWVGLLAKDLKRYQWSEKAKKGKTSTKFVTTSKSINLLQFGAKWSRQTPTGKRTKGVSYRLKTKRRTMKGSFIAKGLVFTRKTEKANSLIPHFSITPTSMFTGAEGDDKYVDTYMTTFDKRYFHELDRLMK